MSAPSIERTTAGFLGEAPPQRPRASGWRGRWQRHRLATLVVALVAASVAVSVLSSPRSTGEPLAPDNPAPDGARAVARLLAERGVSIRPESRFDELRAGPGTTVLVLESDLLTPDRLRTLRASRADLVLVQPGLAVLGVLAPEVTIAGATERGEADPECAAVDAAVAGRAATGGAGYVAAPSALPGIDGEQPSPTVSVEVCYPSGVGPNPEAGSYVVVSDRAFERRVVVIGQQAVLANEGLADEGNAALALRSLGRHDELVWYRADPLDIPGLADLEEPVSPLSLLPSWVPWVLGQLGVATLALLVWRFRRLGRLVPERLPAVVRSVETAEGRARLYRSARARPAAAGLLRAASRRRLTRRLGAGPGASDHTVAELAAQATRRPTGDVAALLHGPPPTDDASLVRLADHLDRLEREVTGQ